jgi:hypothetical protein
MATNDSFNLTEVTVTDRVLGHGSYATVLELQYKGLKCAGKKIHEVLLVQNFAELHVSPSEEIFVVFIFAPSHVETTPTPIICM